MHIYSKTVEGGEANPSDYIKREPTAKVGDTYPDLYSQAAYVNRDIKRISGDLLKQVADLKSYGGFETVEHVMDSVYHFLVNEFELSDDCPEYFTKEMRLDILNGVYGRIELAKALLNIFRLSEGLSDKDDVIKLTKQYILL